MKVGIVIKKIT